MKSKIKNVLIIILIITISTCTSVMANSLINSKEVIYDNSKSKLKSTNVQEAVDELYSAATDYSSLNNKIDGIIDKIYPVGSIYISAEDDTKEKVESRFGGTWERYAEGRTIIGVGTSTDTNGNVSTYSKGQTGGISKGYIAYENLPDRVIVDGGNIVDKTVAASGWANYSSHQYVTNSVSKFVKSAYGYDYKHLPLDNIQPYITTYMYKRIK